MQAGLKTEYRAIRQCAASLCRERAAVQLLLRVLERLLDMEISHRSEHIVGRVKRSHREQSWQESRGTRLE